MLTEVGEQLGAALAPVVGTLNLHELVLSGPLELLDGPLLEAVDRTIRERTMPVSGEELVVRTSALGDDVVLVGAAVSSWPVSWGSRETPASAGDHRHAPSTIDARSRGTQRCALKKEYWRMRTAGVLASASAYSLWRRRRRRTSASGDGGPETADIRVWLNGADTPQEARDWLKATFEDGHPGSTLTIEEQEWEGLVEKLTTGAVQESETPDVVEVGNTQAPTFTTAGAFTDLTGDLERLGGDDLLPGFVDGATVDGKTYAVPYYAGSKYVFYRKDLFEKAGLAVPDDDGGVRRRPPSTSRRPTRTRQLLRLLVPGPGLAQRRRRSSGTPAATWPSRTAASGRARCRARSRSRG